MDNLTSISYFKGSRSIPNLNKDDGDDFETTYMNNYQKEYLIRKLGYALFNEFETALLETTVVQKWKDLLNGVEYTVSIDGVDVTTKWNGFANDEELSPITDYTYYKWLDENRSQITGTGVGMSNKENSTTISAASKLRSAWNDQVRLSGNIRDYIYKTSFDYFRKIDRSIYKAEDLCFINDNVKLDRSLFMYLYHHREDFTNWIFTNDTKQNVYGI